MSISNFRRVPNGPLVGFFKIQDGGQDGRQTNKNDISRGGTTLVRVPHPEQPHPWFLLILVDPCIESDPAPKNLFGYLTTGQAFRPKIGQKWVILKNCLNTP